MTDRIYLDHVSASPVDPVVREAMLPFLDAHFGNPASQGHAWGWAAEEAVERARAEVADLLGCEPREIVFTSSGEEADNLAVLGTAEMRASQGRHLIVSGVENASVRAAAAWLGRCGFDITTLPVDAEGCVDPAHLAGALRDDTILVSIEATNHQLGVAQDLEALGAHARTRGAWFHTDARHRVAWDRVDLSETPIDLLSLAGEQLGTPLGVGALFVRRRKPRVRLVPRFHGGGHEGGLRSGALPVAGVVALGAACRLAKARRTQDGARVQALREHFEAAICAAAPGIRVLCSGAPRAPHITTLQIEGVEGESVLVALPHLALATGSACSSASLQPSPVFEAIGLDAIAAAGTVRISLGHTTTETEVACAARDIAASIVRIRELSAGS